MRSTSIRDGTATTLMLAENIQKSPGYSWFGVTGQQGGEQYFGMVWVVYDNPHEGAPVPGDTLETQEPFGQESIPIPDNTDLAPRFARPGSAHSGGVFNVAFAGGNVTSIEPSIDYIVYQQLMTPHGAKCVDPQDVDNTDPGTPIHFYRTYPPLTESDYQ
jgi:prepilin-type processing-associated H-X9-DG protein